MKLPLPAAGFQCWIQASRIAMFTFTFFTLLAMPTPTDAQTGNPQFEPALAKQLGADEYGMKMYVLVILKSGSNTTETKAVTDSLFAGHLANIRRLAALKKLIVAGPLAKNDKDYRGIFILDVKTLEEAQTLLETDPAIKADLLKPEMFRWYGSAALPQYLTDHDKIWKSNP